MLTATSGIKVMNRVEKDSSLEHQQAHFFLNSRNSDFLYPGELHSAFSEVWGVLEHSSHHTLSRGHPKSFGD
jgi:hypothetical protein